MNDLIYILPINGIIGEDFKFSDLLLHLKASQTYNVIKLVINSVGGYVDEADKIEQALKNEKKIYYSTNSGDVASAAVQLFLLASQDKRTFDPSKGSFLIHMPFIPNDEFGVTGTSDDIRDVADTMKDYENLMIKKYSKATGTSENILSGFMKENVPLTEEQISTLGFAKIIKPEFKAVAFYSKSNIMSKEITEKLGLIESLVNKTLKFIRPKAIIIQDVNGTELDFGDSIQDESMIVVGVSAMVNGSPADGPYVLSDGRTLVFDAGTLTEIQSAIGNEELEMLKKQNEELKQQIEIQKGQIATATAELTNFKNGAEKQIIELKAQFDKFKNEFSSGNEGGKGSINTTVDGFRRAFKKK